MEWLRIHSIIGPNRMLRAPPPQTLPEDDDDPTACYDSFKQHWQHVFKIIARNKQLPKQDDVLSVVNHLEQICSLLLYDMKKFDMTQYVNNSGMSQCYEYLIAEGVLSKLNDWGSSTGKYAIAIRTEELKLYEILIDQSRHMLLVHEPFMKPLKKLLNSCRCEVLSRETEKNLVMVLLQLCALLLNNIDFVDLFLENNRFIIFELLTRSIHRDDAIGLQARNALSLCMTLSKKNRNMSRYILDHSNLCILLATGLNGLYSRLPLVLSDISVPDWYRLTPDDINDIHDLSIFVTSLEFCNAVAKGAHDSIAEQLQECLYNGFLKPVLLPALLQEDINEQVAVTAYLELILRTLTHPGLLHPLLKFLLQEVYDSQRLLHILLRRLNSNSQMSLVSLALFETLIDIHCEDVMLELIFLHLQPCLHLMVSQRRIFLSMDPHSESFEKFLSLAPACCDSPGNYPQLEGRTVHWNHYGSQQSLYGNYHAYLCDARTKIASCQAACEHWSNAYLGCDLLYEGTNSSIQSQGEHSMGYESLPLSVSPERQAFSSNVRDDLPEWQSSSSQINATSTPCFATTTRRVSENGYHASTTVAAPIRNTNYSIVNGKKRIKAPVTDSATEELSFGGTSGPLLDITLGRLKDMLSSSIYINIHLTGIISKLAVYPHPLLRNYLLDHSLVLQPNVPSLFQIIAALKQQIDEFMAPRGDREMLISQARTFFVDRETRLVKARRMAQDRVLSQPSSLPPIDDDSMDSASLSSLHVAPFQSLQQNHTSAVSSVGGSTPYSPFQRSAPKRRSITRSLQTMFGRLTSPPADNSLQMTASGERTNSRNDDFGPLPQLSHSVIYPKFNEAQHVAVCAVLLDEWVKELAALAQEHTIAQLAVFLK